MSPPHHRNIHPTIERIAQPPKGQQYAQQQHPHRRLGRGQVRQDMYELKLGSRVTVMGIALVGVRVHNGNSVYHVGVGKQRYATYIRNKQYRQKEPGYRTEQPVHGVSFMKGAKVGLFK